MSKAKLKSINQISISCDMNNTNNNLYHNAKALLKIYSKTAWETSNKYGDLVQQYENDYGISDISGLEIVASLDNENGFQNLTERLLSVGENKLIIDTIHSALIKLKDYPYKGELYYQIIYKNYFVKYKYTESEILESLCLARTTYFRRRKEAIHLFGISLWRITIPVVLNMFGTKMGQNWNLSGTDMEFKR